MQIYSARAGNNSDLFPDILKLYVKPGSVVADVTYGKGVFWRNIDLAQYQLKATDLKDGVDMRKLPYVDGELDALVMDPPYMPTKYTGLQDFSDYYGIERDHTKWHDGVLQLYYDGIKEAERVLNVNGVLIVKCQDMVSANRQVVVHNEIINYCKKWFRCEDIFVLVQHNKRPHPQKNQIHARKNHSYFLIFVRKDRAWLRPN